MAQEAATPNIKLSGTAASATPLMLKGSVTDRTASSTCGWPMQTPTRSPASPYAFENVRPSSTFGYAAILGMNDVPPNSMYASSIRTTA